MPSKFDPNNMDVLVSSERHQWLDPQRVISLIPILRYHKVADIGCGPGYFTIPMGKHVFDGKIYALDIQQEMLDATQKALDKVHLGNVEVMIAPEDKLPLEDDSLDGAFASFVVHEAEDPVRMLDETKRCLLAGGWLALLEWHKREMDEGPPLEDRIDEADLLEMAQKSGFRFTSRHSLNDKQYMLLMRK